MKNKILFVISFMSLMFFSQVAISQTCIPMPNVFSPMTQTLADSIRSIADEGLDRNPDVFMIVGDSISGSGGLGSYYLGNCGYPYGNYATTQGWVGIKDVSCYPDLTDSLDFFLAGVVPGATSSFTRDSIAAYAGRSAPWALTGTPSPVQQEIDAINPAYALIMFGANDIYGILPGETWKIEVVADNIMAIADYCAERGIVPIVKGPPTRVNYEEQMEMLVEYLRIASAERQYPFIDVHAATWPLTNHGQGTDGIHFKYYTYNRMCVFHSISLDYGANMHNLVTLQMLDDLYRVVELDEQCLDDCEIIDTDTDTVIDTESLSEVDTGSISESQLETLSETQEDTITIECTQIEGTISSLSLDTYCIVGDIFIPENEILEIPAGTEFIFMGNYSIGY